MPQRLELPDWRRPVIPALAAMMLALSAPAAADGTDPQALRPLLLAPSTATPSSSERHRATVYRAGLKRDIRQHERNRANNRLTHGARRETHGRLGVQSRLNARRGELSRIGRSLRRRNK